MFNHKRLILARKRRRLTGKALADHADMSAITISRLENVGNQPDATTVEKLAAALRYPTKFFFNDDPEDLNTDSVSFRSMSKMSAKERDAAIAAGCLGLELSRWIDERFNLHRPNILDLSYETDPEVASRAVRQHWGIGEKPIGNMLHLLEAN
jgi:transcriptional regulator with XRE-family HTH domain